MLGVTDLLRAAHDPAAASAARAKSPARYGPRTPVASVVVWNITRMCNMTCPHCYAAAGHTPSPSELSTAEALDVVRQLADAGVRIVILSGGEPLLRADVFELAAAIRDAGMAPQVSTNGVLIDATAATRLAEAGVQYVGVSIDGTPSFNDRYRGLAGGFAKALAGARHARRAGMRTGIRTTVTRRNVSQIDDVMDFVADHEIDRFYVSGLVDAGRGRLLTDDDLDRAEARSFLDRLFRRADEWRADEVPTAVVTGGNDSHGPYLLRWSARSGVARTRVARMRALLVERGGNRAGEALLNIDTRGRVHPDQFWASAVLGDVRKEPFSRALEHPLRAQLATRETLLRGRCGQCSELGLCRGSHRERAEARSGHRWGSDPACVLLDEEVTEVSA